MALKKSYFSIFEDDRVDLDGLKKMCINGCSDEIRPLAWKILLNFLPSNKLQWEFKLKRARTDYENFIKEFIISCNTTSGLDHPLSNDPNSRWVEYFNDNEVLLQINKDCKRLYPDLNFFQQTTKYPFGGLGPENNGENMLRKRIENSLLQSESYTKNRSGMTVVEKKAVIDKYRGVECYKMPVDNEEMHWEVAQRILFLYCKTNKAHGYVQGMNEIIGPLYYVFATDVNEETRRYAEADTFYCFIELMRDVQPLFIRSLDLDPLCGIQSRLNQFMDYLKNIDIEVVHKLEEIKIVPEYFAFRWVTLYMSREFTLPDVIRLWDSMFSVKNKLEYMIYVCCALIITVKKDLMDSNFAQAMNIIQNIQSSDISIDEVMRRGLEYYIRFGDS